MAYSLGDVIVRMKADTTGLESGVAKAQSSVGSLGSRFRAFSAQAATAFGSIANGISSFVKKLAIVAVASSYGASRFVNLASELQTTQRRMAALSGSTEEANKVFGQLYQYTLGKPIAFPDAAKAAQTLMGYGIASKDVIKNMKALSSFAIVNGADMGQLALAYGQVNAKGKLMGQEVLQLTNNFVPVTKVISEHFNVSIKKAQELIEDGKVSAQDFNKAMQNFIPEEDIKKQSNTFKNRLISLQGTIRSFALDLLGVKVDPKLGLVVEEGGVFDKMSKLLPKIADSLKSIQPKVKAAFEWVLNNGDTVKGIIAGIAAAYVSAKVAAIGFSIAASANPIGLIAAAIVVLIGAITFLQVKFGIITKTLQFLHPVISLVTSTFGDLFRQIGRLVNQLASSLAPQINFVKKHADLFKKGLVVLMAVGLAPLIGFFGALIVVIKLVTAVLKVVNNNFSTVKRAVMALFPQISIAVAVLGLLRGAFGRMASGAVSGVRKVLSFMSSLPGRIRSALGNLGSILYNAGKAILDGLLGGMKDKWHEVSGWVGGLGDKIKNLKGPIEKDKLLLLNEGRAIMDGLNRGLVEGFRPVSKTLGGITGSISVAGAGTTYNQTKITGPVNIGSKQDADYFFKRLDRNVELGSMGISPKN